jgi:hypothetical protein
LKIPLITEARTITDINGQKSQPRKKAEMKKRARKNHKIILWEVLSGIGPPTKNYVSQSQAILFLFHGPGQP